MLTELHREDVKSVLRKKHGSVAAFERANNLPEKSVNDVLRGRSSARVTKAIENELNEQTPSQSEVSDCSGGGAVSHRLNERGQ
ncbi:hypothetical protein [Sphingomonas paucimobilis]|uniref:Ner winged helix-turn-helix DNA-binding domain-containing protein n=1 Tax=Sphingomonas paucimobilis TaxID=13689 RepID=A0A7T3E6T3_SPHPI|nr:hypothetical protein [Sphingomonas paucimobilis]QPT08616.1 hypothetical protein I6G38_18165 [Sphingomonas paucimobilis]